MSEVIERPRPADPDNLIGTFRRFRSGGPPYVVLAVDAERETATIRVLDSGEELVYPLAKMADDDDEA